MKWISVCVDEGEFEALDKKKGHDTWAQFILKMGSGDEYISPEAFAKIIGMKKKIEKEEHGYVTVSDALDALLFG